MRRFIYDALWTRFEYCKTCGRSDSRFDDIFEQYATCIAECGLGDNREVTESVIVDNWCINGRGDTYKGRLYDRYHLQEDEDKREEGRERGKTLYDTEYEDWTEDDWKLIEDDLQEWGCFYDRENRVRHD